MRSYLFVVLVPPAGARRIEDDDMIVGRTVVAASVVALVGCGGSADTPYSLAQTKACLQESQAVTFPDDQSGDLIADGAPGGSLVADFAGGNSVTIAFGRSAEDAKRMRAAYKLFADAFDTPIDDIFFVDRNVAYGFENTPTDSESAAVRDCLG